MKPKRRSLPRQQVISGTCLVSFYKHHLCLGFILVLVEIQSFSPQDKPTQLPVFHDTPLSLQPACLQCFLLIQRRAGPGDPRQLSKHHALGPCCMDTHIKWAYWINSIRITVSQRDQETELHQHRGHMLFFYFFVLLLFKKFSKRRSWIIHRNLP